MMCDKCGTALRFNLVMGFWLGVTYYYCSVRHKYAHLKELQDAYRKAIAVES